MGDPKGGGRGRGFSASALELKPDPRFALVHLGPDYWQLTVELAGPAGLDRLDSLTLARRGRGWHRPHPAARGPDLRELAAVVWGPLRLQPRVRDPARWRDRNAELPLMG